MQNKRIQTVYDIASILVSSILAVCFIFTFLFKISAVDGSSMNCTLYHGDKLMISARDWNVEYGDIVVISQPNAMGKVLIKRVIATEGQTIEVDASKGTVTVDGKVLDEPYIAERMTEKGQGDMTYPLTVPEGYVFCMGDNRNASTDSRFHIVGLIDTRYIVGEAFYRIGDKNLLLFEA